MMFILLFLEYLHVFEAFSQAFWVFFNAIFFSSARWTNSLSGASLESIFMVSEVVRFDVLEIFLTLFLLTEIVKVLGIACYSGLNLFLIWLKQNRSCSIRRQLCKRCRCIKGLAGIDCNFNNLLIFHT